MSDTWTPGNCESRTDCHQRHEHIKSLEDEIKRYEAGYQWWLERCQKLEAENKALKGEGDINLAHVAALKEMININKVLDRNDRIHRMLEEKYK